MTHIAIVIIVAVVSAFILYMVTRRDTSTPPADVSQNHTGSGHNINADHLQIHENGEPLDWEK